MKIEGIILENYVNDESWNEISLNVKLTSWFIKKYENKLKWELISQREDLTLSFIEKYKDKLDWDYISCFRKVSQKFIEKYQDRINWNLLDNQKISKNFRNKYIYKFYPVNELSKKDYVNYLEDIEVYKYHLTNQERVDFIKNVVKKLSVKDN